MSGKELYDFIYSHGYSDFCSDSALPDSLKPTPKSLDWLFAFPKLNKVLDWLLHSCSSQTFQYSSIKQYKNLPLSISYERIQEISDLLDPPQIPASSALDEHSLLQALRSEISLQESELVELEKQAKSESQCPDLDSEEFDIRTENQELECDVLAYLENLAGVCPVVSLQAVQSYLKSDEELTEKIIDFSKLVDLCLNAIDESVFQRCLRSDRGEEFTALCLEKKELEELALETKKQYILACAALEGGRCSMKSYEKIITSNSVEKKELEQVLKTKNNELEELDKEISEKMQEIDDTNKMIQSAVFDENEFENLEILFKKKDFSFLKFNDILSMIDQQKSANLVAFASVLNEMCNVQEEYDKLFNIQSFFEDVLAQSEFRAAYYEKYKMRADILSEKTKIIDERNEFFYCLAKAVGLNERGTFDELFSSLEKVKNLNEFKKKSRLEGFKSFARQAKDYLFKLQVTSNEIREKVMTKENLEEIQGVYSGILKLERDSEKFIESYEVMNKDLIIGELGVTERDVFVEYLLEKEPLFLKECRI